MADENIIYTLRDIPGKLHRRWKTAAAYFDMTMRDFALMSIEAALVEKEAIMKKRDSGITGE